VAKWDGVRGKRVLITGATNGIGLAGAEALAARGAKLAIVARSESRAQRAVERITSAGGPGTNVDLLSADLSSQASVRRLAEEVVDRYPKLEVLINNAGAMYTRRQVTEDGIELTWAVNHLAPFLLTTLLLDRLKASAPARIITTSSDAHHGARIPFDDPAAERSYRGFPRYGQTKLANILFTSELARRLEGTEVTATCFHPGLVHTGFNHNNGLLMDVGMIFLRPFSRSPEKGAETLVWLADSPDVPVGQGVYFVDEHLGRPSSAARDEAAASRLWELSEEQTRVTPRKPPGS
jgi:NAD(P)-dependent dehydrogenase (short-subunit alcohol dehydrogenase family)